MLLIDNGYEEKWGNVMKIGTKKIFCFGCCALSVYVVLRMCRVQYWYSMLKIERGFFFLDSTEKQETGILREKHAHPIS